jgi:hypothetical protein
VLDAKAAGGRCQPQIRGPQAAMAGERRGQEMGVDPSESNAVQFSRAHEVHDFRVRHGWCVLNAFVRVDELCPAPDVADQEFTEYEVVAGNFILFQQAL